MPSWPINNLTAPDQYTAASTLYPLPILDHVNLDVANQAIFWSIAQTNDLTTGLSGAWQPEVYMTPGSRSISRQGIVGIRVRAAVPAASLPVGLVQAQVTVEAVEE
jgi:hypothetical protein